MLGYITGPRGVGDAGGRVCWAEGRGRGGTGDPPGTCIWKPPRSFSPPPRNP